MKSKLVAARFLSTILPFLVGLLLVGMAGIMKSSGADEKKQAREESWKTLPSPTGKTAAVEVRFTDNSVLKLKLDDDRLELTTSHGKLSIAIPEIHRIDFATRVAPDAAKRIQLAIRNLGSSEFRLREAGTVELMTFGSSAYPALIEATKDKDPEVVRRAEDLLERVRSSVPEEELEIRKHDVVHTEDSKISGWIQGSAMKATTTQFGPVLLKLADLRSLRSLSVVGTGDEATAALDPGNLVNFQNQVGKMFAFRLTGAMNGSVWGTDIYTADSNLASAAVHAGAVKVGQTKVVKVKIVPSPQAFQSSSRNGVTSSPYGNYPGAFQVLR
jgi:LCCL domain-containing protein